jgi:peptidylprolyl isomerase
MTQVKTGDTVTVHYELSSKNGTLFDSSFDRDPLQFQVGNKNVIPALDKAVIDMKKGDEKSIDAPCEDAFGPYFDDQIIQVDRKKIPSEIKLEPGLQLRNTRPDGRISIFTVKEIAEDKVSLDTNHPLAGQEIKLKIQLIETHSGQSKA